MVLPDRIEFRHGSQKSPVLLGYEKAELAACVSLLSSNEKMRREWGPRVGLGSPSLQFINRGLPGPQRLIELPWTQQHIPQPVLHPL